ncbi:arginine--tRNA ligase, partial [Sulfolobus sp. A20-N-F6]
MDLIGEAKIEIAKFVSKQLNVDMSEVLKNITYPPREDFGDLSIPLPSIIKGNIKEKAKILEGYAGDLISSTNVVNIYLNSTLNVKNLFIKLFTNFDEEYGFEKIDKKKRIIVEHTSANPIHPLHIGHLRNTILGDSLSRALKFRGHEVNVRFYVNDTGRQVAVLILGLKLLGFPEPDPNLKKDLWLGLIYAMTNVIIEIKKLREEIKKVSEVEYKEKIRQLDEMVTVANELRNRNQALFDKLIDEINKIDDVETEIGKIIKEYEKGETELKSIIRKYVKVALDGFMETLSKLNISFDNFDFESDLLWENKVNEVLDKLIVLPSRINYKGVPAIDLQNSLDSDVRERLRIPKGLEIPPLVLTRSDGTTLYTVRDIAYSLYKFNQFNADIVINVIAEEQYIPQIQLRGALHLLGYSNLAENLVHYS